MSQSNDNRKRKHSELTKEEVIEIKKEIKEEYEESNNNKMIRKVYENGIIYEGEFIHDKRHGKGKLTLTNGNIFKGEFNIIKNDMRDY